MRSGTIFCIGLFSVISLATKGVAQDAEPLALDPEEEAEFAELERLFEGDGVVPTELPAWFWLGSATGGVGYDDNVLLGSRAAVGSAFVRPQAELFGSWIPDRPYSAWLLAYYEGRYFDESSVDDEHLAVLNAAGELDRYAWLLKSSADFIYARQIYDATTLVTAPDRQSGVLTQYRSQLTASARRPAANDWYTEVFAAVARSAFREIDEDYWSYEGEARVGHEWSSGSGVEFYLGAEHERYIDAVYRDPDGFATGAGKLRINRAVAGGRAEFVPETAPQWELSLDAWAEIEDEQDGDYYDRWRASIAPEVDWSSGAWTLSTGARWQYSDFRLRHASFISVDTQWQEKWSGHASSTYAWNDTWKSELLFEYVDLQSNRSTIRYTRRAVTCLLTYTF